MKSFITPNPYLSCAGLALATNAAVGVYAVMDSREFFIGFLASTIFGTLPAILIATIDKYVHQNITENVPIQYGLTTAESVLGIFSIGVMMDLNFSNFYSALVSLDFSAQYSINSKLFTASILIQSLGFKYILDSADEEMENDQSLFGEDNLQDGFEAEIFI